MTGTAVVASPAGRRWQAARWPIRLLAVFAVLGSLLAFTQTAMAATASDNFNRANGALGASWTKISDGAMTISGQAVAGTSSTANTGDLWTASTFTGNQFSQITTSTQLTGGQWIGVAVRANNTGQQAYVGIYYWNNGSPDMRLYRRSGGTWIQLGSTYASGALAVGSQLQIQAVGSKVSLLANGTPRISVTDTTLTAGKPGIIAFGKSTADNWTGGDVPKFSVGGNVSGLTGSVVLQDNGGDNLTVSANGPFTFATKLASGAAYAVTVQTQPAGQTCTVASGSGTIGSADVTNVAVSCTTNAPSTFSVGGTVSGLSGSVVLQDNGGDNLTVSANGPFTFATKLASGAAYAVTVQTQPAGQTCTVASGSGTIGSANVTNVAVSCASNPTFSVGGNVSGLTGSVVLQDNSGDDLTVSANGPFTFATQLAAGASYNVTVKTQPSGQTCTVASGTGTIGSANVTNVAVSCAATGGTATSAADGFNRADGPLGSNWADITDGGLAITSQAVAGTKTGAGDAGLTGDSWAADTFTSNQYSQVQVTATQLTGGQWIGPSVRAQSGGQNGYVGIYFWNSGSPQLMLFKRSAGNWTQIGGTVNISALTAGATLAVQATGSTISFLLNGTQKISATDTSFTGGAPGIMSFGTGQVDNWTGGSGTVPGGTSTFTVGGTVSGLTGTVVLQDNGGDDLSVTANGSFTFATPVTDGGSYAVTVKTQPSGQTCTVASGSGTVSGANVTSVAVTCAAAGGGGNGGSTPGADTFNRANGPLGPDWTDVSDGGLAITSQQVAGTAANGVSGDIRTAETYPGDQFSSVTVTTTQLTGGQWIGPMVRANSTGQQAYVGIYYWNSGSPDLMLFERSGSNWTQLGSTYNSGPLNPGDKLQVQAVGSTVSFLLNGVQRISATDTTLTGGAPGIMSFGTGQVDNWAGGSAGGGGTTTYTIGGTVSGLTGTVILQDNSGDSLSVAANGSFTFATPLADGATYNVTVRTNPSGQTCTVANGTGTVHAANVTSVSVTCAAGGSSTPGSDDFNRADGPLGPSWADVSDGGLAISGQQVTGTVASGVSGDIRTAETYQSDQFSQVTLTSTQLTGSQWIGPAVRMQNGGQNAYVGIYNWNGGSPNVMLFERNAGNWTQLGSTWNSGALAAGTTLKLMVTGSTLALMVNGTERIAVGDTTLSGGAPGIMANGTAQADNWSGGAASFEMHFLSTTGGISSYDIISASDSDGPHVLRVLQPTNPAAGVAHNFLFVLPVEPETGSQFGDAISYLKSLGAQNQYNLTIIEPAFGIDPWYADSSTDPNVQYETFMTQEMVPWAQQNLSTSGHEQNWLIGFSKSGIGGQDLILKHPGIFQLAASWDFPADMSSSTQFGDDSAAGYGTDANFQANYRLTQAFVDAHKGPFVSANRIWIGGYGLYQTDDSDYDRLLTTEGIQHTTETPTSMSHTWTSGWVPGALAALYADSQNLP
jgi:hypothetical protein